MIAMGYSREEVERSLKNRSYDDPFATYLLLGAKSSEVIVDYCKLLYNLYSCFYLAVVYITWNDVLVAVLFTIDNNKY